jgi:hypothetical protein
MKVDILVSAGNVTIELKDVEVHDEKVRERLIESYTYLAKTLALCKNDPMKQSIIFLGVNSALLAITEAYSTKILESV